MKRPRQVATADHAIWLAMRFLEKRWNQGRGCFPADLANDSGMTRLEAQLALLMVVEIGEAVRNNDGRFFKDTRPKNAEFKAAVRGLS
jgi:hypothetical protein